MLGTNSGEQQAGGGVQAAMMAMALTATRAMTTTGQPCPTSTPGVSQHASYPIQALYREGPTVTIV